MAAKKDEPKDKTEIDSKQVSFLRDSCAQSGGEFR
jgi:hypothetical protein